MFAAEVPSRRLGGWEARRNNMHVTLTAVGPDNRGLADPIVHYVATAGANIHEIQMYDHDSERLFAMLLRVGWPEDQEPVPELRRRMSEIGRLKGLTIR